MTHLRRFLLVGFAGAWLAACGSDAGDEPGGARDDTGADAADVSDAEPVDPAGIGSVRGVVRDAATDRPIAGALVSAGPVATTSDADGSYVLSPVPAGEWTVRAYERGFAADSAAVATVAERVASVDFTLTPAEPPCCDLAGEWTARFTLDSAGIDAAPRRRELTGTLAFATDAAATGSGRVASAGGSSELDFGPLLDASGSARVGRLEGVVFAGDSVAVTLLPRFGDWAVELRGTHANGTIRGDWFQRASCCGAYGGFVLTRAGS